MIVIDTHGRHADFFGKLKVRIAVIHKNTIRRANINFIAKLRINLGVFIFFEAFKNEEFKEKIGDVNFIQDNESKSSRGVLRGLHYQKGEYSQAKLVRVIKGRVLDVAVDLRKSSPTFGRHVMVELSEDNKKQFFIPRGFAHGFLVLSDEAVFTYKVDNVYAPQHEASIRFDDAELGIDWPMRSDEILTSKKDLEALPFRDAEYFD